MNATTTVSDKSWSRLPSAAFGVVFVALMLISLSRRTIPTYTTVSGPVELRGTPAWLTIAELDLLDVSSGENVRGWTVLEIDWLHFTINLSVVAGISLGVRRLVQSTLEKVRSPTDLHN